MNPVRLDTSEAKIPQPSRELFEAMTHAVLCAMEVPGLLSAENAEHRKAAESAAKDAYAIVATFGGAKAVKIPPKILGTDVNDDGKARKKGA